MSLLNIAFAVVLAAVVVVWLRQFRRFIATECGHETYLGGSVMVFGRPENFFLTPKKGRVEYCVDCIAKMSIRCAWCGQSIFVGEPITLYPAREGAQVPTHAVPYKEDESDHYRRYVGCVGSNCADTGADRGGFWVPPGQVYRMLTAYEQSLSDPARGGDGIVLTNDPSRP